MSIALNRQMGVGLGAIRFGFEVDAPPTGTDPDRLAAARALIKAEALSNYQTLMSSNSTFYGHWQNLANHLANWPSDGTVAAATRSEIVSRTNWLNNFANAQTSTPPPTTTTPPASTTNPPPAVGTGIFDGISAALANLSTPMKIGGAVVLGYILLGRKRR